VAGTPENMIERKIKNFNDGRRGDKRKKKGLPLPNKM
jgi:hypothetical protein